MFDFLKKLLPIASLVVPAFGALAPLLGIGGAATTAGTAAAGAGAGAASNAIPAFAQKAAAAFTPGAGAPAAGPGFFGVGGALDTKVLPAAAKGTEMFMDRRQAQTERRAVPLSPAAPMQMPSGAPSRTDPLLQALAAMQERLNAVRPTQ